MFTMEIEINGMVPFPGTQLFNRSSHEETKVYVKLTNTGLLLHYKSHVDVRYKRALLRPMLDRAFRLSFDWSYFCEKCDRLKLLFSRLNYPDKLINFTISRYIVTKVSEQPVSSPAAVSDSSDSVRQLQDLSRKTHTTVSPVFVSQNIECDLKIREAKPPFVNQHCFVYKFERDLCDAGYVLHILPLTPANWGTQKRKFIHRLNQIKSNQIKSFI